MPPYQPPEPGNSYRVKFIRAGGKLFVTSPGDVETFHSKLAEQDGLTEAIDRLRRNDPSELDAGFLRFLRGEFFMVTGESASLGLPIGSKTAERARDKTRAEFTGQTPGYTLVNSEAHMNRLIRNSGKER